MRMSIRERLELRKGVAALAAALFVFGFGEELWSGYVPAYMRLLGATPAALGLYGTLCDLLDAVYAYPGGIVADRIGSRRTLLACGALTLVGNAVYLAAPSWPWLVAGLLPLMAWPSMGLPATFDIIASSLPRDRRLVAFSIQSVIKRVPIVLAPPLGGLLIGRLGMATGIRIGLAASVLLSTLMLLAMSRVFATEEPHVESPVRGGLLDRMSRLDPALKQLLACDCLVRLCEGIPEVFLVVWALEVIHVSPVEFGLLVSAKVATSILSYVPAAALGERVKRKPFVIATFLCFTLFPVAVVRASSFTGLLLAFIVGGLREIGEPTRKSLIADLAEPGARARSVGVYYLVRGLVVSGAAAMGGVLWQIRPELTFHVAALLGLLGTLWCAVAFHPVVARLPASPSPR